MKSKYSLAIEVETNYLDDQSVPEEERYVFSYTIVIVNTGSVAAKLISRHWIITDGNGEVQEVQGAGVVGEQPHLEPGKRFRYTSGTVLDTPVGTMHGSYHMRADDGHEFEADIPVFRLSVPQTLH